MAFLRLWYRIIGRAVTIWTEANAFALAAAVAFFTLFSIAPVIIVLVSTVGLVYGEEAAQGQIVARLQETIGPRAAESVQTAVARSQLQGGGLWATLAGVGAMLLGATAVFGQLQRALNTIWDVAPKPTRNSIMLLVRNRVSSLAIVLSIGLILTVSLVLTVALNTVVQFVDGWVPWQSALVNTLEAGISLALVTALFAAIFRTLPDVRLSWRDVTLGALITAILFSVGRLAIAFYLTHTATASTYGAAASLVLLLLWVNYSSLILLFGAALTRARLEALDRPVPPSSVAVRVRRTLMTEDAAAAPAREAAPAAEPETRAESA